MAVGRSPRQYLAIASILLVAVVALPAPASATHYCASNYAAPGAGAPPGSLFGRALAALEVLWAAVDPVETAVAASASCSEGASPGRGGSTSNTGYGRESWAYVSVQWNGRNSAGGYERMSDTHSWSEGDIARTYHSCSSAANGGGACGGNFAYTCSNPDDSRGSCDAFAEVRL